MPKYRVYIVPDPSDFAGPGEIMEFPDDQSASEYVGELPADWDAWWEKMDGTKEGQGDV